jgi:hypothetical protein
MYILYSKDELIFFFALDKKSKSPFALHDNERIGLLRRWFATQHPICFYIPAGMTCLTVVFIA